MKLNVEITTRRVYYGDDALRRAMKLRITEAINEVLAAKEAELNSLRFVEPTTKKRSS